MKYIVEYKLCAGRPPYFIEDGGYFPNDGKMIGITYDSKECFIPKLASKGGELVDMSIKELKSYAAGLGFPKEWIDDFLKKVSQEEPEKSWFSKIFG